MADETTQEEQQTAEVLQFTRQKLKWLNAAEDIHGSSPEETRKVMRFTHAVFCQVGLPRSKVSGSVFLRQSGSTWINVQAGYLDEGAGPVLQPIPYGVMPRLGLAWVSTYAVRHKTREIPIGDSAAEFLRLMGIESTGRRHISLRQQMHALAAARLQLGFKGRTYNGQPVAQFDAWMPGKRIKQRALWPGTMVLSEDYYSSLIESAVPLDNRALQALKGSALALDIYAWMAHRLHRIKGRPEVVHWKPIREQFAQEYSGKNADKDFKRQFLLTLKKTMGVYPEAKIKVVSGGLLLMRSPPPIPHKASSCMFR